MTEESSNKVKIRFKFRSGEEFEAEGTPAFIEQQRGEFLQLIGKSTKNPSVSISETEYLEAAVAQHQAKLSTENLMSKRIETANAEPIISAPGQAIRVEKYGEKPSNHASLPLAQTDSRRIWEELTRIDAQGILSLRHKSRLLSAETAALLLIAAAKILLGAENGYSALGLMKALGKSGYAGGRLDRILAAELRQGTLKASGSKRSRAYILSDEGFAKAYVLAEKLREEYYK